MGVIFGLSSALAWPHLLDDTFIHLRYAWNWAGTGEFQYNIGETSNGSSSPAYDLVLGAFGSALERSSWPALAKSLSIAGHSLLVLLLVALVWRGASRARARRELLLGLAMLTAMLLVPTAARWLQDGMETSLACLAAVGAALAAQGAGSALAASARGSRCAAWAVSSAAALVIAAPLILRLELAVVTVSALALAVAAARRRCRLLVTLCVLLSAAWCAWLWVTFGALLSDASIAKRIGTFDVGWIMAAVRSLVSVSPLWVLPLFVLPVLSVAALRRERRDARAAALAALGLLPTLAMFVAGASVGQFVHGARYFLPGLAFAWACLLLALGGQRTPARPALWTAAVAIAVPLTGISVLHAVVTLRPTVGVLRGATIAYPPDLSGPQHTVAAFDIGRLGWVGDARMIDLSGLVNGRAMARLSPTERLCAASARIGPPEALFLTEEQAMGFGGPRIVAYSCGSLTRSFSRAGPPASRSDTLSRELAWHVWRAGSGGTAGGG